MAAPTARDGETCTGTSRFILHPTPGSPSYLSAPLPPRAGARPSTSSCLPHAQLTECAPAALHDVVMRRAFSPGNAFPGSHGPFRSLVSTPDSQAHHMREGEACTHPMMKREWAHVHGQSGGLSSWHLNLSEADAAAVLAAGWGERHLLAGATYKTTTLPAGLVMVYAPRDAAEADTVFAIVDASYAHARS